MSISHRRDPRGLGIGITLFLILSGLSISSPSGNTRPKRNTKNSSATSGGQPQQSQREYPKRDRYRRAH
ncbi:unnamed protein product [Allacma fusca]|uniref:Transmembrane protein n=1 Tax=Allacma fusca TaxID=39272 RepID=A0A8J2L948_9HEXA|nr:unnamed protein product [Allacma fusca]